MLPMDETDLKILRILRENSRIKYVQIAKKIGLSEGAVRRRIRKLLDENIIKKFTIETAAEVEGIVLIKTEPTKTGEAVSKIRKMADKTFEVSGDYDIAAFIQAYTIEELNKKVDEIRKLPSVLSTNTLIRMK
ncbi:transcriptional regulator [Candidatus Bathyarchaeota archaeon]|nr:MAG: Lrp/AsnC family transcriptional regulator [Candidatus Bathyarchaeota archaeon]RLG97162.1 MAG: transcriptional regulator [Candidatus Bathyarchaeota archaeon]